MELPTLFKLSVKFHFEGLMHFKGLHFKTRGHKQSVSPLVYRLGRFLSLEQDLAQDSKGLPYSCHHYPSQRNQKMLSTTVVLKYIYTTFFDYSACVSGSSAEISVVFF